MITNLALGDAFNLPFKDGVFDVVIADPPYEGKARGKMGVNPRKVGYIPFKSRHWFSEATRVLKPSGHLYLFIIRLSSIRGVDDFGRLIRYNFALIRLYSQSQIFYRDSACFVGRDS